MHGLQKACFLVVLCVFCSAQAKVMDKLNGKWFLDLGKTQGVSTKIFEALGNPAGDDFDIEQISTGKAIVHFFVDEKGSYLHAHLKYPGIDFVSFYPFGPFKHASLTTLDVPIENMAKIVIFYEDEDKLEAHVHNVGTDVYYTETFSVNEDGDMVQTIQPWSVEEYMTCFYTRINENQKVEL